MTEQELLLMEALACTLEEDMPQEEHLLSHLIGMGRHEPVQPAQTGISQIALSQLPVCEWVSCGSSSSAEECPLCIGEYEPGEMVMRLPCLHGAHEECMSKWLHRSPQCPVCKLDVEESIRTMMDELEGAGR